MKPTFAGPGGAPSIAGPALLEVLDELCERRAYLQLAKPSERDPVQRFARVDADLYDRVLNRCVEEGQVCMHEMMAMNDRARAALPADQCTPANAPQTIAALERPAASLAPQAEAAQ